MRTIKIIKNTGKLINQMDKKGLISEFIDFIHPGKNFRKRNAVNGYINSQKQDWLWAEAESEIEGNLISIKVK